MATQTYTVVPAATGTLLVAANPRRSFLLITNIGTGRLTLGFGATPTVDQGTPLSAAAVAGDKGGSILFESVGGEGFVPGEAIYGISTAGTAVAVVEG